MVLSRFIPNGNLPAGIHASTWQEVEEKLAFNARRKELLAGLKRACDVLKQAGCKTIYIGGSYSTSKEFPGDFDVCWKKDNVDLKLLISLDPVLLTFENKRAAQKAKYGGELFIADFIADSRGRTYLDFFQEDRNGNPKGIVEIQL